MYNYAYLIDFSPQLNAASQHDGNSTIPGPIVSWSSLRVSPGHNSLDNDIHLCARVCVRLPSRVGMFNIIILEPFFPQIPFHRGKSFPKAFQQCIEIMLLFDAGRQTFGRVDLFAHQEGQPASCHSGQFVR